MTRLSHGMKTKIMTDKHNSRTAYTNDIHNMIVENNAILVE